MVGRYKVGGGGGSLLEGGILLVVGRGLPLQSPHPPMPPVGKYLVWQGGESTFGGIKICWWWGESTWGRIFLGVGGMNKFSAGGGDSLFHSPSPPLQEILNIHYADHSVHHLLSAEGGWTSYQIFKKEGGLTGPQFLEGGC